jgi:Na+/H+-dicarboxylate symporter
MSQTESTTSPETKVSPWWQRITLTLQILIALVAAVSVGIALGAGNPNPSNATLINNLAILAELVLKALCALATPLILVAVLHTLMTVSAFLDGKKPRFVDEA